jgi:pimeloyl-ACP methyl ester carboxylesterase
MEGVRVRLRALVWLLVVAMLPLTAAAAPASDATAALMQSHLIDIGGGRHLNLICIGEGEQTVVFENGLGSHLLQWSKIAGPVSEFAEACFYDRAGYGFSEPSDVPATAMGVTDDLHALLKQARIGRSVILVGHSIGGLYTTLYTDRFFDDVAGLVLIDPSFARQDAKVSAAQRARDEAGHRENVKQLRACAALARAGQLGGARHAECFVFAPNRTAAEIAYLTYQFVRPHRYERMAGEMDSFFAPAGQVDDDSLAEEAAARSFGDLPLVVLTAGTRPLQPGESASERANNSASWKAGHEKLAARSTRGESIVVPNAGHFIHIEQPEAVVAAIRKVVEAVEAAP